MKKSIYRSICVLFCLVVLCACLPASAFAVDPVSAGIMADAFAQAIAAYGASNGVAMTFDVSNTNGIGESVHELWSRFRAGTQDADDYATLAAALFPDLYYKASVALGTAADVYTVGYNISAEYAEEFDNFYNWLLTGPAEMVKVDNQYFQFSSAQVGSSSQPIICGVSNSSPFFSVPYTANSSSDLVENGLRTWMYNSSGTITYIGSDQASDVFSCLYLDSGFVYVCCISSGSKPSFTMRFYMPPNSVRGYSSSYQNNVNIASYGMSVDLSNYTFFLPMYDSQASAISAFRSWDKVSTYDSVGVKAYSPTGIASFPDTADPNYEAVAKRIPSDIPWDDTAYGDGTGTLTDAQAGTIAADASEVLVEDGVLTLADTATPGPGDDDDDDDQPSDDPDDYLAVGLEDIFPFCIPFDIYNFLSALAAEPVAPHFTATLAFPQAVGGTQTIEIDFDSPTWNQLSQLLRLLELLAFIVGLALLTRSMFIRG